MSGGGPVEKLPEHNLPEEEEEESSGHLDQPP